MTDRGKVISRSATIRVRDVLWMMGAAGASGRRVKFGDAEKFSMWETLISAEAFAPSPLASRLSAGPCAVACTLPATEEIFDEKLALFTIWPEFCSQALAWFGVTRCVTAAVRLCPKDGSSRVLESSMRTGAVILAGLPAGGCTWSDTGT